MHRHGWHAAFLRLCLCSLVAHGGTDCRKSKNGYAPGGRRLHPPDTVDADVRPETGALFRLGGLLDCSPTGTPVNCRILLRVRDAKGRPIVGARFAGKPPPAAMDTERSDEFGRLFRQLSESGRLEGLVTRSGYLPASVSQACSPGVDRDVEVNVVLRQDR